MRRNPKGQLSCRIGVKEKAKFANLALEKGLQSHEYLHELVLNFLMLSEPEQPLIAVSSKSRTDLKEKIKEEVSQVNFEKVLKKLEKKRKRLMR